MASNSFGTLFRITTWGESHGKAVGVIIDGCPAGVPITEDEINTELTYRATGRNPFVTSRKEKDHAHIYSGVYDGQTTGCPIAITIYNQDADSSHYQSIKDVYRPGHANYTYMQKYGVFDERGGGRSSARETVGRVAAGAIAKKILERHSISICSFLKQAGEVITNIASHSELEKNKILNSPIFCPDPAAEKRIIEKIQLLKEAGDSIGGIVETVVTHLPIGLGDPVYEKIEARLAYAMLGLPASKGFEIGEGFKAAEMLGSEHNDGFTQKEGKVVPITNHAGGTLGGITTGDPLIFRVAFKPTSSIKLPQESVSLSGKKTTFQIPEGSRHDPCVAIRAVPIVESMTALVLVDALLKNRICRI